METLIRKLESKNATVGVIGLGYVGLPLAVLFAEAGFAVLGFDNDERKKESLRSGISYIQDIPTSRIASCAIAKGMPTGGQLGVASSIDQLSLCDAVIVCVPTPLAKSRDPDLSFIVNSAKQIRDYLKPDQLIVLESTTYPGTTRELVLPILTDPQAEISEHNESARKQLVVGKDFFLAFSPERVDPGNKTFTIRNTPKVIGGITKQCAQLAQILYSKIVNQTVPVSSTDAAEMTKLLENTFRLINIGLVNEFSIMCQRLNVDVWEVIEAAATKPFGFIPFYPGPGLGGHCIPVDPHYLSWKLRLNDYRARFIELASDVNSHMPVIVIERVAEALNSRRKSINGSKVGVLGVAYKKDIEDVRESPALDILTMLAAKGADLSYHDPYVPSVELHSGRVLESSAMTPDWLATRDCILLITDHSEFQAKFIAQHSSLIVDTRNMMVKGGCGELVGDKVFKL